MRVVPWAAIGSLCTLCTMMGLGCTVEASNESDVTEADPDGSVTVDWSIDEAQDQFVCSDFGVDSVDVTVFDDFDGSVTDYTSFCEDFAMTIVLPPGAYAASAVLLDVNGREVTTSLDIAPFTIVSNTDLAVPIDFPADSFY